MKKVIPFFLTLLFPVLLIACGDSGTGGDTSRDTTPPEVVSTYPSDATLNEVSVLTSIEIVHRLMPR